MKGIKHFFLLSLFLGGVHCSSSSSQVAATIDGKSITLKELDEAFGGKIAEQIYQLRQNAVEELIAQKLLEQEAAKKNISVEQLLTGAIQVPEPSEAEIKAIYEANKDRVGEPLEKVRPQIINAIKQNRRGAEQNNYLAELRKGAKVEIKLKRPPVKRVEVSVDDDPFVGPKEAPVTVVEFSDYQCPFCGRARSTVKQMTETYKDKVKYVFRDFPLSFHQDAFAAHVAANCAGEQGKYWEFNAKLFAQQKALKVESLKSYAQELGLDTKTFNDCLDSNKYAEEVKKDMDDGIKAGVNGTPAFFINGIPLSGARPFSQFQEIIDDELKK